MRLYNFPMSTNGRRVNLAAAHLGLSLEQVGINLMNPDDRRRLGEINANNKVPVLEDEGFVLWESCAIMQYLASKVPGQTVYPEEAKARADVNRWMFWGVQHFSPAIGVIAWENAWKKFAGQGETDPVELARGERDFARFAAVLDQHLAQREWVSGDGVTLADYALAAPLMVIEKARLPVAQYAHLLRWFERVKGLDAWKATA
jgi:glutathione S-transferase